MVCGWRNLYEIASELHLELWVGIRYGVGCGGHTGGVKGTSKQRDMRKSHTVGKCNQCVGNGKSFQFPKSLGLSVDEEMKPEGQLSPFVWSFESQA